MTHTHIQSFNDKPIYNVCVHTYTGANPLPCGEISRAAGFRGVARNTVCNYMYAASNYSSFSDFSYHSDGLRVYGLRDHTPLVGHIIDQFIECRPFDLFELEVGEGVEIEVKDDAALAQLLDQQFLPRCRSYVWGKERRKDCKFAILYFVMKYYLLSFVVYQYWGLQHNHLYLC